jgi:hypothetical protein
VQVLNQRKQYWWDIGRFQGLPKSIAIQGVESCLDVNVGNVERPLKFTVEFWKKSESKHGIQSRQTSCKTRLVGSSVTGEYGF